VALIAGKIVASQFTRNVGSPKPQDYTILFDITLIILFNKNKHYCIYLKRGVFSMQDNIISTKINSGTIHFNNHSKNISDIEWVKHPKFKGVYIKNLIKGVDTYNLFSSHLVQIDPDCCLEKHCHENQMELHEVIEGSGLCQLMEGTFNYYLGKMLVIPKGEDHRVHADKNGLFLLAKFFPALL
jgi:quercetin dioxygenase-like cupin family protein